MRFVDRLKFVLLAVLSLLLFAVPCLMLMLACSSSSCGGAQRMEAVGKAELRCVEDALAKAAAMKQANPSQSHSAMEMALLIEELPCIMTAAQAKPAAPASSGSGAVEAAPAPPAGSGS